MSEASNPSKGAEKILSEKKLLKLARKSWAEGKPVSTEMEAALIALVPDFFQNNVLRSVAGMVLSPPALAETLPEVKEQFILARTQRNKIVSSAEAEIDAVFVKVQLPVLNPASPTYKKDLKTARKNLESWKRFFTDHRNLFQFFPSLKQSEESLNESLRALHELSTAPVVSEKSKKENDLLSRVRTVWEKGETLSDFDELILCDAVSTPENRKLLMDIARLRASGVAEKQQERIIASGKNAVISICNEALNDAHAHARAFSRKVKASEKERLKIAHKTLYEILALGHEFPQIREAYETVMISLDPPFTSNGKISLASSLIEQGKSTALLKAIPIETGVVTGVFARERIGQLLTSTKMTPEAAEWTVNYLGDCIRRADGEKRAKAISIFVQESAVVPLARQRAIEEAASIASKTPHTDQRQISKMLHESSRKASLGSPEKTLFLDFAREIRRYEEADPKLFPTTVEERKKAGGAFKKDTTVIMTTFHSAVESEERAAKGEHPLTEMLAEFDTLAFAPKKEPTGSVVVEQTLLLTPETIAAKFAKGEKVSPEELEAFVFKGQPPHRIVLAAKTLMDTTPAGEEEKMRNRMVTSILMHLSPEDFPEEFAKWEGQDIAGTDSLSRFVSSLAASLPQEKTTEPPKPAEALPAPKEPEPKVTAPTTAIGPEAEPGYPLDISVRDLLKKMDESPEPKELPGESVRLAVKGISNLSPKERRRSFKRALLNFSEGKEGYSELDFIKELSAYVRISSNPDANQFAIDAAEALLSLPAVAKIGPIEAQELRTRLASASPEIIDAAILSELNFGNKNEAGQALLVLVERAEINGRVVEEGKSLYEIALTELSGMEKSSAVPALFALADSDCPQPLLLKFLVAYPPKVSGKAATEIILAKRSEEAGAVFSSQEADAQTSNKKAKVAVQVLQSYGGGARTADYDEALVAKGAAKVPDASAIKFLIQGMRDSEDIHGLEAWKAGLRKISGKSPRLAEETESLLISSFYLTGKDAMGAAFDLLAERPSVEQADFMLSLAAAQNGTYSEKAKSVLANYNFSSLKNAESFAIMRWMHIDNMPAGKGAALLQEFIPAHSTDAKEWMNATFLSDLFNNGEDAELAKIARESLISNSGSVLSSRYGMNGVEGALGALGSTDAEARELGKYALASQMITQGDKFSPSLHKSLYYASAKFKKEGSEEAILGIISAAHAAFTQEAMRQVLVPYLAAEKPFSDFSARALLSSTEGAHQLALAAGMENHPVGLSKEGSLRISQNAFNALSQADTEFSSRALVSLLMNKKEDLHLSAYEALSKAGDSKCPALIGLLDSGDSWERYAAVKLLPRRDEFVSKVLPLSIDKDASVSISAKEYVLSVSGAKGLASILSNPDVPEEIQQALSAYCARNKPDIANGILALAQTEGKGAEQAMRALEFFPTDISFPALLSALDSGKGTAATARETLVRMCWLLSTDISGADAENAANDLFEVYAHTKDPEVRNAIVDAARGSFAEFMLEDAIQNEGHAQAALEIFIKTENTSYGTEVAQYLKGRLFLSTEEAEGLPPLWQVLFSNNLEKMDRVRRGTPEYQILKEVSELEFIHGQGSLKSKDLLFAFMKRFGSAQVRDSLFEKGPQAVSEFLWSMRGEANEDKAALWLRSMKDPDTNLLLDVLVDRNYSTLDKLLENPDLSEAVLSHAMRRALLSSAELSKESGIDGRAKAAEGFGLYCQLLSRDANIGMPLEGSAQQERLRRKLGLIGKITEEGIAEGKEMIRALCQNILEVHSLRVSARSEARKLSRQNGSPEGDKPLRRVRRISENPS